MNVTGEQRAVCERFGVEPQPPVPGSLLGLHVEHVASRLPAAVAYLALPQGWRCLLAPEHEDVWYDESLLRTSGPTADPRPGLR